MTLEVFYEGEPFHEVIFAIIILIVMRLVLRVATKIGAPMRSLMLICVFAPTVVLVTWW